MNINAVRLAPIYRLSGKKTFFFSLISTIHIPNYWQKSALTWSEHWTLNMSILPKQKSFDNIFRASFSWCVLKLSYSSYEQCTTARWIMLPFAFLSNTHAMLYYGSVAATFKYFTHFIQHSPLLYSVAVAAAVCNWSWALHIFCTFSTGSGKLLLAMLLLL